MSSKKKSLLNSTTICMLLCAIAIAKFSYESYQYNLGDPFKFVEGRIIFTIFGSILGAIMGLILVFFIHIFFKPSRTNKLLEQQNKFLYDNNKYNKNSKVDELNKLNELRKNGVLCEKEFIKLKNEILNRK